MRVNDVNVGAVTKIERQDRHALVTIQLNGDVNLPANATAALAQTSLLGSLHIAVPSSRGPALTTRIARTEGSHGPLPSAPTPSP